MNLIITTPAEVDLYDILNFIEKDNISAAEMMFLEFKRGFDKLKTMPKIGRKRADITNKDVLFLNIKKNYFVVYKIMDEDIVILRIFTRYQDIGSVL